MKNHKFMAVLLRRKGATMRKVAASAQIPESTLSALAHGKICFGEQRTARLKKALNVVGLTDLEIKALYGLASLPCCPHCGSLA